MKHLIEEYINDDIKFRRLTTDDMGSIEEIFEKRKNDFFFRSTDPIPMKFLDRLKEDFDQFLVFGIFEDDVLDTISLVSVVPETQLYAYSWSMHQNNKDRKKRLNDKGEMADINNAVIVYLVMKEMERHGYSDYYTSESVEYHKRKMNDPMQSFCGYSQPSDYRFNYLESVKSGDLPQNENLKKMFMGGEPKSLDYVIYIKEKKPNLSIGLDNCFPLFLEKNGMARFAGDEYTDVKGNFHSSVSRSVKLIEQRCFVYEENFIPEEIIDDIIKHRSKVEMIERRINPRIKSLNFDDGKTTELEQLERKLEYRYWLDLNYLISKFDENFPYSELLTKKIMDINNKYYRFDIRANQGFHFMEYGQNSYVDWHRDGLFGFSMAKRHFYIPKEIWFRKLAFILMLSDESEYEGGELQFVDIDAPPDRNIISVKLTKGEIVVIPSFCMHRVTPVTKGKRLTLVAQLGGPAWR